jgi:MFS family permease
MHAFWGVVAALFAYFVAFNILEASLPSLVSKIAPPEAKGTAMGVYNTSQALGLFFGGAAGGWLAQNHGFGVVFAFCAGSCHLADAGRAHDTAAARQNPDVPYRRPIR